LRFSVLFSMKLSYILFVCLQFLYLFRKRSIIPCYNKILLKCFQFNRQLLMKRLRKKINSLMIKCYLFWWKMKWNELSCWVKLLSIVGIWICEIIDC
jgi:hypothetical protein